MVQPFRTPPRLWPNYTVSETKSLAPQGQLVFDGEQTWVMALPPPTMSGKYIWSTSALSRRKTGQKLRLIGYSSTYLVWWWEKISATFWKKWLQRVATNWVSDQLRTSAPASLHLAYDAAIQHMKKRVIYRDRPTHRNYMPALDCIPFPYMKTKRYSVRNLFKCFVSFI